MRLALVLAVFVVACSKTPKDTTISVPAASVPSASTVVAAPSPSTSAVPEAGPKSPRNEGADKMLAECGIVPPPSSCTADSDCEKVAVGDNGCCPTTLWVGVAKSDAKAFAASVKCKAPECTTPAACLVHWERAETGDPKAPLHAPIVVRCTKGTCLTAYQKR